MRSWKIQSARYLLVGLVSNLLLYFVYLALTSMGMGPKISMTLLFVIGTCQTFVFNKKWTFEHPGSVRRSFPRYFAAYGGCYLLNFVLLLVLVDRLQWPHQWVQAAAIILNAALLFILQRFWVFSHEVER